MNFRSNAASAVILVGLTSSGSRTRCFAWEEKGKVCRMEQQCHWENFKKFCVYVKVCR